MKKCPKPLGYGIRRTPVVLGLSAALCMPAAFSYANVDNGMDRESVLSVMQGKTIKGQIIIRKSKFPQNPKRSVRFSGKRTKRSVQKRKARNTQKAETKVL